MKNLLIYFAHADELHTEDTTASEHMLTSTWILVALYVAVLVSLWFGFARSEKLKRFRLLGTVIVSLPVAFISYTFSPPLAVAAIIIGFAASLLLMVATATEK